MMLCLLILAWLFRRKIVPCATNFGIAPATTTKKSGIALAAISMTIHK